ncbi:MAG: glycerophosphodiester phosphodiesterase [Pedobacter sp.]|nr:MAG: glycerophosphodiester phosphodiesterase [Pedobacter sp.]
MKSNTNAKTDHSLSASSTALSFPSFSAEAHRGGRGLMPENTIVAMLAALKNDKVTTLEMDTHITKDKQVIVTHDPQLNPNYMLTPQGVEIPKTDNKKYVVYQMNYDEIKAFDNGSKGNPAFPQQEKVKAYIPKLSDLIEAVQTEIKNTGRKQVFYNIETKSVANGDGNLHPAPAEFVDLLIAVIQKHKIQDYVVVQSFDKRTIQYMNTKYPQIKASYLVSKKNTYEYYRAELGFKPFIISPDYKIVDAEFVRQAHAEGVKVIPWTVNTKKDMEVLNALKVDGIITDYPNLF